MSHSDETSAETGIAAERGAAQALGHVSLVIETCVLVPDPSATSRPELLHRDHVLHPALPFDALAAELRR